MHTDKQTAHHTDFINILSGIVFQIDT